MANSVESRNFCLRNFAHIYFAISAANSEMVAPTTTL